MLRDKKLRPHLTDQQFQALDFKVAYNKTSIDTKNYLADLFESFVQFSEENSSLFWRTLAGVEIMPDFLQEEFADSAVSIDKLALVTNADVAKHVEKIYKPAIAQGKTVVAVAHSQGNYFVNQAHGNLTPEEQEKFSIVAVATPDSFVAGQDPPSYIYTTLCEDFIRLVPFALDYNVKNNPAACDAIPTVTAHFFVESYLASGSNSETKIVNDIVSLLAFAIPQKKLIQTGDMFVSRAYHTATLLKDGRVLITGGYGGGPISVLSSAEVYDPNSGTFSPVGSMNSPRWNHNAVLLDDGKVLIAGGHSTFTSSTNTAEIYDPSTGQFTFTGSMTSVGSSPMVKLNSGKVIAFDAPPSSSSPSRIEIYDPSTGIFTHVADMVLPHRIPAAILLLDGTVLITGGFSGPGTVSSGAEIYDPVTNVSTLTTGNMNFPRFLHGAVTLKDGRGFITGESPAAELYNPVTKTFTVTGDTSVYYSSASQYSAVLLQDGRVLVSGNGVRIYNPVTDTFTIVDTQFNRGIHVATLLQDGRVLLAGGDRILNGFFVGLTRTAFLVVSQ